MTSGEAHYDQKTKLVDGEGIDRFILPKTVYNPAMSPTAAHSDAFLQFVLSRARVTTQVCSFQQGKTGYTLPPRTVPDYNFIFCLHGRLVWVVDGVEYPLKPGDLVLVPPGVQHHAYSSTKRFTLGSIHVTITLPGGQDVYEMLVPPRHRRVSPRSRLERYLAMAAGEWSRGDSAATILTMPAWGRLVALELLRHDAARGLLAQRPADPLLAEMLDELSRRIAQPTSLADLAARSGYTPQHLNRTFRRELGVTPLQHLARLRMEHAAALLAEGRLTVKAIAAAVACDDPYYFSRTFRQHFGRSPMQYRVAAGSNSPF